MSKPIKRHPAQTGSQPTVPKPGSATPSKPAGKQAAVTGTPAGQGRSQRRPPALGVTLSGAAEKRSAASQPKPSAASAPVPNQQSTTKKQPTTRQQFTSPGKPTPPKQPTSAGQPKLKPAKSAKTAKPATDAAPPSGPRKSRWVGALLILITVAWLGYWVTFESIVFRVKDVEVVGQDRLAAEVIKERLRPVVDTNIWQANTSTITPAMIDPAVATVEISRKLPRTVVVRVHERVPLAQIKVGGQPYSVDREGVIFQLPGAEPPALRLEIDDQQAGGKSLRDAATVLAVLPKELRDQVESVSAPPNQGLTLQMNRQRTVVWGTAADAELKAKVLGVMVNRDAALYDVSAPMAPVARPRGSTPPG